MASQLTGDLHITAQDLFTSSSVQQHGLGERAVTPDGRSYRYCLAGGTSLVPGKVYQASAEVTANQNLTPTATAAGATTLTTSSTVTVTANQYAGGFVIVTVTPGQGYQYKIKSHPAATAAAVTLTLEDPIQVALTTSSRIDLVANPYSGVIVTPTTASSTPLGVAVYPVTNGQYGWLQVGGISACLADGALTVGTSVVVSNAIAGAVEPATGVQAPVGYAATGVADTEYGAVFLTMK